MGEPARQVWLAASENAVLPGGKVGGVGDVVRDLPPALVRAGCRVRVIVPSYGAFHRLPGAKPLGRIRGTFAGGPFEATAWQLPSEVDGLEQVVIDHSLLCPGQPGEIYHRDAPDRPYETDSSKFAFFCAVLAAWLEQAQEPPDLLHLHDWHTGLLPVLRRQAEARPGLAQCPMVFTIHNLAYQGVRPLAETEASLRSWFPELVADGGAALDLALDPHDPSLVNFMAAALRAADGVSTVSPTYAEEIRQPNDPVRGFHGGEGLEDVLAGVAERGCLVGILNGCEYPPASPVPAWPDLVDSILAEDALFDRMPALRRRFRSLARARPRHVLLSIGRIVGQKVSLFLEPVAGFATALDAVLEQLGDDGVFILLGSGDPALEAQLRAVSERRRNFLFLRGYAEGLSDSLYRSADLFLMPSSFEPCGISQMLAMRAGVPCVVHGVGGLRDTVEEGNTGFVFDGASVAAQAEGLVAAVARALAVRQEAPERWQDLVQAARDQRFSWDLAARRTIQDLYQPAERI